MSFNEALAWLAESQQIIRALALFGIVLSGIVWYLHTRVEEYQSFLKDDGLQGKFSLWKTKQEYNKRVAKGQCPYHGYMLSPGEKCAFKACKYARPSGREEKS